MIGAVTALFIFGKMHFLLILENEFTHEIKSNGMRSSIQGFHGIVTNISHNIGNVSAS